MERTGCTPTDGFRAIEAVDEATRRIRGMVGYDMWTENSCQAHMAVDAPIVWRALLQPAFEYPFEQCGKGIILAVIPDSNHRSLAMTRHLGFRQLHRVIDGWAVGEDLLVFEMRREWCRYGVRHQEAA